MSNSTLEVHIVILKILSALLGVIIVVVTILSAVGSFVVPRAMPDFLSRLIAVAWRRLFNLRIRFVKSYVEKDRVMAFYAPITLVSFPMVWLTLVTIGYMFIFWATGNRTMGEAYMLSGSSLLTLGFASSDALFERMLIFSEAAIGLIMVALLISYLPTMYSAFSRRESAVTMLDVRAGSPPSAVEMILRIFRIGEFKMDDFWEEWENWFAQLEESHTSLAILVFYRSPVPEYSWVTASGAVLDAAALSAAVLDTPRNPKEELCIRAGYLALRRIASFFSIEYNEFPTNQDPISIRREEFDQACETLAAGGVPIQQDRDQAWLDFKGWRVNYDTVLLALCNITMAPYAPWSSDRAQTYNQLETPPVFYGRGLHQTDDQ